MVMVITVVGEEEPGLGRVLLVGVPGAEETKMTIFHVTEKTSIGTEVITAVITRSQEVNVMFVAT